MVKHMHTMITDTKTSEMMVLFENDRLKPASSAKEQILYRILVRSLMSADENMFKISYNESNHNVNIQFISLDDLTISDHENAEEQYNYYVTSYVMSHPTEGVPASKLNMPFSRTFIESVDEDSVEGRTASGLKVSVCENSYRLFFESGSHDEFVATSVYQKQDDNFKRDEKLENLKKLVDGEDFGWKSSISEEDGGAPVSEEGIAVLLDKGADEFKQFEENLKNKEKETDAPEVEVVAEVPVTTEPAKPTEEALAEEKPAETVTTEEKPEDGDVEMKDAEAENKKEEEASAAPAAQESNDTLPHDTTTEEVNQPEPTPAQPEKQPQQEEPKEAGKI
jgi:paired amphipathic helix protein Sin3a